MPPRPPRGEPVTVETANGLAAQIEQLRRLFPQAFAEGRVDWEALRAALGDFVDDRPERYAFTWAGKRDALRLLQTPSRATLLPCPAESLLPEGRPYSQASDPLGPFVSLRGSNFFVEGDNLEVLKLLYKPYFGRVKLIYIDPPYNTGNDFVYPDNYADALDTYLKLTGQRDAEGNLLTSNPETGGRYHSAWLSMMYPRLFLARQLLREDGVMIVSIDDAELANLRLMLNEIFGEENFVGTVIWNSTKTVTNTALISVSHTYNLIFARSKEYFVEHRSHFRLPEPGEGFANPDNDPRGPWKADPFQVGGVRPNQQYPITNPKTGKVYYPNPGSSWKNELKVFEQLLAEGRIVFGATGDAGPQRKRFQSEAEERGRVAKTLWDDVDTTANATRVLDELFGQHVFDNPKPVSLIKRFVQLGVYDPRDAIILDFFAGSCTTAQAVLELNHEDGGRRRFIMVQLPEPLPSPVILSAEGAKNLTPARDSSASPQSDTTILRTIADMGKERLRHVAANMSTTCRSGEDLGFAVFKLAESNFKRWRAPDVPGSEAYAAQMEAHADPLVEGWAAEAVIYEVALKEGYGLNMDLTGLGDLPGLKRLYRLADLNRGQSFYICLDDILRLEDLAPLALKRDDLFICRDRALDNETAANLALQCRLKTI